MKKHRVKAVSKPFRCILSALIVASCFSCMSQGTGCAMTAPGGDFEMHITRTKGEVMITVTFSDSLVFDYIAIERKPDFERNFAQCKYITWSELNGSRTIVSQDNYPYPGHGNVAYRLKLVSRDGPERLYPPVVLRAVSN
jgi:hypothetical protein